ncbi:MAG: NAD-dependent epimerase/dehydratase family protein [Rectinemataceae bacterium]|nr:NAD-dependent epimerase/dehydratase family protein [Rectinemataceae bacterium]
MKVLITGGSGTISRFITGTLARQGHEVILLNHHCKDTGGFENVRVVIGDRKNHPEFIRICREIGPFDCVYDMISFTAEDAASAIEAFRGNTGQLVYCSTVDVYTKTGAHYPVKEDSERKPSKGFPYACQKALSEDILMGAHERGDFRLTIVRPAHIYAEGSPRSHLLFHAFKTAPGASYHLDRIKKGKPIIMHGDGMSVWNITHGSDAAKAFTGALGNDKAFGKAYTVAGDECMSYRKYWDAVAEVMGAPPIRYVFIAAELIGRLAPELAMLCVENFMFNNIFDNSAAKADLGFEQTISWRDGIKRCLDVFEATGGFDDSDKPEYAFYDRIIEEYTAACDVMVKKIMHQ